MQGLGVSRHYDVEPKEYSKGGCILTTLIKVRRRRHELAWTIYETCGIITRILS